ncbi:MAG: tRNA pseudouridine(38-40) synthase TruA [Myxococcota bacterium]
MSARRTILLFVQYDGTEFSGWQQQRNARTVQAVLREAVEAMLHHPVALHGSSRTDAGVHARALPVSFETERTIPPSGFLRGLNSHLPSDAAVVDVQERPPGWRPRDAAVAKTYRYQYQVGIAPLPLVRRQCWHVRRDTLDLEAMRDAASRLVGEHDFSAFRSAACDARTTRRRMYRVDVERGPGSPIVRLTVTGNAFLRYMVRIMAGTLFEVGAGRRPPAAVDALLAQGHRPRAGVTAPPGGLTLMEVHFEGYPRLGKAPSPLLDEVRGGC